MKSIVYQRYGGPDVLQVKEVARPTPKAHEVLVHVHAASVSSADWRLRSATFPSGFDVPARLVLGVFGPWKQVLGVDLAGEVVQVGDAVQHLSVGDRVVAYVGNGMGCYSEFRTLGVKDVVVQIPDDMTYEQAAAIPFGGVTALRFLQDFGALQAGEKVIVVGASGAVGSAAVQIAKHLGAHVTAVCSTRNIELAQSLGADAVIDYTTTDYRTAEGAYDIVFDTVGEATFAECAGCLRPGGRLLLVVAGLGQMLSAPWFNLTTDKRVISGDAVAKGDGLKTLVELTHKGLFQPLIDRSYPMDEVAQAHAYLDTGRKRGSVLLRMGGHAA